MLTFILIGGLVWLAVAAAFVFALAAAARAQVSSMTVAESLAPTPESLLRQTEAAREVMPARESLLLVEAAVLT